MTNHPHQGRVSIVQASAEYGVGYQTIYAAITQGRIHGDWSYGSSEEPSGWRVDPGEVGQYFSARPFITGVPMGKRLDKFLEVLAENPDRSNAELARIMGVCRATIKRYRRRTGAPPSSWKPPAAYGG